MMLSAEAQAAIAAFEEVRQRVAALNDHLQAANAAIRLVKEQAAAGNRPALAADLAQLNAVKARHSAEIALRCAASQEAKLAKAVTEVRRKIGRRAGRARVGLYVEISDVAVSLNKKHAMSRQEKRTK